MNSGKSDASTSTDDIQSRPLCLFYFTHPFGVLSPEPPIIATTPPHIARAFLNMEPVSPFHFWSNSSTTDSSYNTTSESSKVNYDLGKATVHKNPVNVVSVAKTKKCIIEYGPRRDSISSSLFSSDIWLNSSASSKSNGAARRMVPYSRILPPLQLPSPKYVTLDSPDDLWPKKCLNPEKFSLPPIEMPSSDVKLSKRRASRMVIEDVSSVDSLSAKNLKCRKPLGVRKLKRRRRLSDVRRVVTCLMRRAIRGHKEIGASPALQEVLHTIREAWAEPKSLFDRCRTLTRTTNRRVADDSLRENESRSRDWKQSDMPQWLHNTQLSPAPGASPGLMRRRYSVPETIMRKYRLAQQRSESEEIAPPTCRSPASASPARDAGGSPCESPHRFGRHDREGMRKSALLRRLWGRGPSRCCCCAEAANDASRYRETRSLDGSRSELRPLSGGCAIAGWTPPKRQRLDSPRDPRVSDHPSSQSSCSPRRAASSCVESILDQFTDNEASKSDERSELPGIELLSATLPILSSVATLEIGSDFADEGSARLSEPGPRPSIVEASFGDISNSFTSSASTAKRTNDSLEPHRHQIIASSDHIHGLISGGSDGVENDEDALPYDIALSVETPSYEVLEIVVSEALSVPPSSSAGQIERPAPSMLKAPVSKHKQSINIDEYVSNILVESLNSLSDQLEYMKASMGSDRKISIVEKEIKVKLQNTGVNTIVHLSPTSNNQIIFGNEELCNNEDRDVCNNPQDTRDSITIRDESHSVESNNNLTSAGTAGYNDGPQHEQMLASNAFTNVVQHDTVNKAVLQQIQKLFQDELHNLKHDVAYPGNGMPGISHIEVSNVDVYINNNTDPAHDATDAIEMHTRRNDEETEVISGIGAGNYYADVVDTAVVPRFSAFPHTDSMEVNTSSSDDAEIIGSDCTSLVDSLDDPNSPRSVLMRRSFNGRRSELVRSAIDVLDLLPESASHEENTPTKDKGESFFIRIKDDDYDCEKENINVADHMPEKIKQRLHRRHRKRELRMECTRRSKVKQLTWELGKKRFSEMCKSKREIEKECMAIINSLIDDVILKIAQDEYKCMRIKKRPTKLSVARIDEGLSKRNRPTDKEPLDLTPIIHEIRPLKIASQGTLKPNTRDNGREKHKSIRHQIHGKLSLVTRPSSTTDPDQEHKRIYQKSEIHEGNKFIEILEILEYVNGSRTSPETTPSDENHNYHYKNKKSRIPIPVSDKNTKTPKIDSPVYDKGSSNGRNSATFLRDREERQSRVTTNVAPEPVVNQTKEEQSDGVRQDAPELRARRSSFGFKRSFDVIPEEKLGLNVESSDEERDHSNSRHSKPTAGNDVLSLVELPAPVGKLIGEPSERTKGYRSVGTSPFSRVKPNEVASDWKNRGTMTSPNAKSAATSPLLSSPPGCCDRAAPKRLEGFEKHGVEVDVVGYLHETTAGVERRSSDTRQPLRHPPSGMADAGRPELKGRDMNRGRSEESGPASDHKKADDKSDRRISEKPLRSRVFSRRSSMEFSNASCRKFRSRSMDRRCEDVKLPECKGSSSDSGESAGSLLCSMAPKWLSAHARQKRHARRRGVESTPSSPPSVAGTNDTEADRGGGGGTRAWSVTVAGSCRAALPADVEMRLRFPHDRRRRQGESQHYQECTCRHCASCACSARAEGDARPPLPPAANRDRKLTLTMKKEALDSSILATRSSKKSTDPLPDMETYAASQSKLRSSVKTRRGYSLHCWLPDAELTPIRPSKGLSVLGCAIIPELKPRVPTMSERDLTRVYTPRHYLRS